MTDRLLTSGGTAQDGGVFLPREDDGRVTRWSEALWRLAHGIRGLSDEYDAALERSAVIVEQEWF